ncbi:MAG: phosphotransferase [Actinobacteria bacterium]|nr:phosphotransferase [Actinomycetota bacterium]
MEAILEHVENHTDLALIAITDHDEVIGAYQAREIVARRGYRFEVIVGTEVSTLDGHLLGLFMEKRVPWFMSLERTIDAIHAQGGVCIVPHPMSPLAFSVGKRKIMRVTRNTDAGIYLDGVEIFNPTMAGRVAHIPVRQFNQDTLHLAEVGGSDSHQLAQIGTAFTVFPGHTAADFRKALEDRSTRAEGEFWTAEMHLNGLATQQWQTLTCYPRQWHRRVRDIIRQIGLTDHPK